MSDKNKEKKDMGGKNKKEEYESRYPKNEKISYDAMFEERLEPTLGEITKIPKKYMGELIIELKNANAALRNAIVSSKNGEEDATKEIICETLLKIEKEYLCEDSWLNFTNRNSKNFSKKNTGIEDWDVLSKITSCITIAWYWQSIVIYQHLSKKPFSEIIKKEIIIKGIKEVAEVLEEISDHHSLPNTEIFPELFANFILNTVIDIREIPPDFKEDTQLLENCAKFFKEYKLPEKVVNSQLIFSMRVILDHPIDFSYLKLYLILFERFDFDSKDHKYNLLGMWYHTNNDFDNAIINYKKEIECNSKFPYAYKNYADLITNVKFERSPDLILKAVEFYLKFIQYGEVEDEVEQVIPDCLKWLLVLEKNEDFEFILEKLESVQLKKDIYEMASFVCYFRLGNHKKAHDMALKFINSDRVFDILFTELCTNFKINDDMNSMIILIKKIRCYNLELEDWPILNKVYESHKISNEQELANVWIPMLEKAYDGTGNIFSDSSFTPYMLAVSYYDAKNYKNALSSLSPLLLTLFSNEPIGVVKDFKDLDVILNYPGKQKILQLMKNILEKIEQNDIDPSVRDSSN